MNWYRRERIKIATVVRKGTNGKLEIVSIGKKGEETILGPVKTTTELEKLPTPADHPPKKKYVPKGKELPEKLNRWNMMDL